MVLGASAMLPDLPSNLALVADMLTSGRNDDLSAKVYSDHRAAFLEYAAQRVDDLHVAILVYSKQPEEARAALAELRERFPQQRKDLMGLCDLLCENYPNYVAARRDRAVLGAEIGRLDIAMQDLEFVVKREEKATRRSVSSSPEFTKRF
jgi:hypothetical protein